MAFNWIALLDSNHITYATSGSNVSRGHIAVHCPFCGPADPSQHMSINVKHGGWNCWRSDDHSGKSPTYLVQALLKITREQAQAIVGDSVFIPENFLEAVMQKINPAASKPQARLRMPDEFMKLDVTKRSAKRFVGYLLERGFSLDQIKTMRPEYGLRYCTQGRFRGRIMFPVWYEGALVTWTGRTIYPDEDLRYKTLESNSDDPKRIIAAGPITDYLLWYDQLLENAGGNRTLVLCEGPFDSLKVSILGREFGIDSTCFTTATPSARQVQLISDLADVYKHRFLLLDRGTLGNAIRTLGHLTTLRFKALMLPADIKDPGLLTRRELRKVFSI